MFIRVFIRIFLLSLLFSLALAEESSYERDLPPALFTDANMCQWVDCNEVLPDATLFSERKGSPPYVEGYKLNGDTKELVGYVLLSTDIDDTVAYSGKPIITLIGIDTKGAIIGIRILKHSEPILLLGIPESSLLDYLKQYIGRLAGGHFEIGNSKKNSGHIDAISGATVTVIAQNQLITRSIYEVARQVGIIEAEDRPQAEFTPLDAKMSWDELIDNGSIQHLDVNAKDIGIESDDAYLDLYFGYLNAPVIGRSILGDREYNYLMKTLKPNEHALFIVANGIGSFKGSGFVRGGLYDRIQVRQEVDTYTFYDTDYSNLYTIHAQNAPRFRETGVFIIKEKSFSAAYPWQFSFLLNNEDKDTREKTFISFDAPYWLPAAYLEGGHPDLTKKKEVPIWLKIWNNRIVEIAIFILWVSLVIGFFVTRDIWVRKSIRKNKKYVSWPKTISWLFSIGFVGFFLMAQPSITQVLTVFHSIRNWNWSLFLTDPFIFIFWWVIVFTTIIWGRGLFCGWMCPFGSLTELLYKITKATPLKKFQGKLPMPWHNRLKWLKYLIFFVLLGISFYSMSLSEKMAEVEPFKTTFLVGVWNRSWPFVLFWSVIIFFSLIVERPFCKYLCPLGAGLAIPSRFALLQLRRKKECTTCTACAVGCGSQSINPKGEIDSKECMLCLDCMVFYYDAHSCPPLSKERKLRASANQPLTPINKQGYYIPIYTEAQLEQLNKQKKA